MMPPPPFATTPIFLPILSARAGREPVELGVAPDDPGVILSRLEKTGAELVITTGGMGKGAGISSAKSGKDWVSRIHFDRLNLVPGKGSALATGNGCIFLGLPGNPWAGRIVYEEIAAPVIRGFLGLGARGEFLSRCPQPRPDYKKQRFLSGS